MGEVSKTRKCSIFVVIIPIIPPPPAGRGRRSPCRGRRGRRRGLPSRGTGSPGERQGRKAPGAALVVELHVRRVRVGRPDAHQPLPPTAPPDDAIVRGHLLGLGIRVRVRVRMKIRVRGTTPLYPNPSPTTSLHHAKQHPYQSKQLPRSRSTSRQH